YNQLRLIELLKCIVDIHYENFRQTGIYEKIANLTVPLNYKEQDELEMVIEIHFNIFIHNLRCLIPAITKKEILICCLSFRFSMQTIGLCLGYTSTNTVRQHKIRIKRKMLYKHESNYVFDFIFCNSG
ncbi:MAG: hypothetical protein LBG77_09180, partial [Dysgonamonadaceae bacterium]|nr:hypothetical protein [Dysgonamonadaceae bacterium]